MSYSQEGTLKLTVKSTIKESKTVLTGKELNKLLDTKKVERLLWTKDDLK